MKKYWTLLSARFRQLLQYRVAALAGVGTQVFWGLVMISVMKAFYAASTGPQPISLDQVITYKWLGQAMLALVPWSLDRDVEGMIKSGSVVYELTRPMDLFWTWYIRGIALRVAPALMRAIPIFILATLFFGMHAPASLPCAAAWLIATLGAVLLASAITTLVQVTLLYTLVGDGISRLLAGIVIFFSGMILPIPLFPTWSQPIFYALPFWTLMDGPFRIYTNNIPVTQAPWVLLHQTTWILILITTARYLLRRALTRLVIQGG